MTRVILMRHAKSSWSKPGLSDHARPLNARGRGSAKALGEWLHAGGYVPDLTLCSDAARTQETWHGLQLDTPVQFRADLYLAGAEHMLTQLALAEVRTVLLIGHNPGVAMLAAGLVQSPPAHPRFADYPTGATLVVDCADVAWGQGRVVDFVVPRELV